MTLASQKNEESSTTGFDIEPDLVRIIYASVPLSLVTVLINSAILSFIQWDVIAHSTILVWFFVTNSLSLIRLMCHQKLKVLGAEQAIPLFF
jgi:hypothetical protein